VSEAARFFCPAADDDGAGSIRKECEKPQENLRTVRQKTEKPAGWHGTCWYGSDGQNPAPADMDSKKIQKKFFGNFETGTEFAGVEVNPPAA